jgi:hypothetical protein
MSTNQERVKLNKMAAAAMAEVLDTQLHLPGVETEKYTTDDHDTLCVQGHVAMHGPKFTGDIFLQIPSTFVRSVAQQIFGFADPSEVQENDLKDVVGELSNMVGGRVAAELLAEGLTCTLVPPEKTIAPRFKHVPKDDAMDFSQSHWLCEGNLISLTVQKKLISS